MGLDHCYVPLHLHPQDLKVGIESLRVIHNLRGFNVTVPHKERILPLLDDVTEEAREIGAVNTVEIRQDRRFIGHNTDAKGFMAAFHTEMGLVLDKKAVLIIGAGGAARAVGYGLTQEGVGEIIFINRTPSRARGLAEQIKKWSPALKTSGLSLDVELLPELLERVDVLIHTTALGLAASDPLPISIDGLNPSAVVCDLVYHPGGTAFSIGARQKGFKVMDGLPMLVHQGALAFEIWTGQRGPVQVMFQAIQERWGNL